MTENNNAFWPFVAGIAIGVIVGGLLMANAASTLSKEHNSKYHSEAQK